MNSRLFKSMNDFLQSNRHSDCKFIIETPTGNRVFECHKLIFSCASDVFDRMLFGNYTESTSGEVTLTDVDAGIFEKFREYIYTYDSDKLEHYDFDTLCKLSEFGDKYLADSIRDDCLRQLLDRMETYDIDELLRLFQLGHALKCKTVIKDTARCLQHHPKTVLNSTTIYQLSTDVFKAYLQVVDGKLSEPKRFNLISLYLKFHVVDDLVSSHAMGIDPDTENYKIKEASSNGNSSTNEITEECKVSNTASEEECKLSTDVIAELLALIDFGKFTVNEFHEGPGKSSLLTMTQKYENLYKIIRSSAPTAANSDRSSCGSDIW